MASLVTKCKSSLLLAFSDEIRLITNTLHSLLGFLLSDDLFSSLIVAFSDETDFITNSMTSSTFNDESIRHKKLKLLATNFFVIVDQFGFASTLSFGTLNTAQPIATKSMFRR